MAYPDDLVIGGTDVPRILVCGNNLIVGTDSHFEDTKGTWTDFAGTSVVSRYAAGNTTHYGEYVLAIQDNDPAAALAGELVITYGSSVNGKTFSLTLFDFADQAGYDYSVLVYTASETIVLTTFTAGLTQERRCHVFTWAAATQSAFTLRVYGCNKDNVADQGIVFIDEVECREVTHDWEPTEPDASKTYGWGKEEQSQYDLIDGTKKDFRLGWRFYTAWDYNYINPTNEASRSRAAAGIHLIVYPNKDKTYNVDCFWTGEFTRKFLGEVFSGHTGGIIVKGVRAEAAIPYSYSAA